MSQQQNKAQEDVSLSTKISNVANTLTGGLIGTPAEQNQANLKEERELNRAKFSESSGLATGATGLTTGTTRLVSGTTGLSTGASQGFVSNASLGAPIVERTYEQAPTVIKHQEQGVFQTHQAQTQIDKQQLPVRVETHIEKPIIKEHHKDVIHEHHQNVVHEHHKNVIHEQHQNVVHETHQPIIHKEEIREIHQPVIHETHKEVIHDISKPVVHESYQKIIEEQYKGPTVHQEFTKPVVHEQFQKPIIEKRVEPTVVTKEVQSTQHFTENLNEQKKQELRR